MTPTTKPDTAPEPVSFSGPALSPMAGASRRGAAADRQPGVTVIVPAFNEETTIEAVLEEIKTELDSLDGDWEILVVNDGSTDGTSALVHGDHVRHIEHPENLGYGAAVKSGFAGARFRTLATIDADGTYPASAIRELVQHAARYPMVVGARVKPNAAIPLSRRPAKWFLGRLASYLAGRKIPDLNSGLRVIDADLFERFLPLVPAGFSLTTTLTLAALCSHEPVLYLPIDYRRRGGTSKIRPFHALDFLLLVLRTTVYFNPLKVFLPVGFAFFLVGFGKFVYDLFLGNMSETAILGFLGAFLMWGVGLLADQNAQISLRGGRG